MRSSKKMVLLAIVLVIAIVVFLGLTVFFENALIFFPSAYPQGTWDTAAVARGSGTTIEDHFFESDDGFRLHSWWATLDGRPASEERPVILFFHGNAGNLSDRAGFVIDLTRLGADVLIVDYRGYGRSQGRPNEQGIYRDADASWRFLTTEKGVPGDRIVIFGKSLGGVAAVDLATRVRPAGLVVQSSFTSVPDMAVRHYPFIPRFLIRTRMDNLAKMGRLTCPVLVVHSTGDEVAPFVMGRELFDAAGEPKTFFEVRGAGHNETIEVGGRPYFDAIGAFVRDASASGIPIESTKNP